MTGRIPATSADTPPRAKSAKRSSRGCLPERRARPIFTGSPKKLTIDRTSSRKVSPSDRDRLSDQVTEPVVARSADFRFAGSYIGLEHFAEAGALIGWSNGEPVRTPYPDCVLVMPSLRQLRPGVTVVRLGRLERERAPIA